MSNTRIYGTIALGVLLAGAIYLNSAHRAADGPISAQRADVSSGLHRNESSQDATSAQPSGQPQRVDSVPPADPRLAALAVSPPNDLIEFVVGENGKVIAEIDKDPASLSFRKPLREYTYAGDRIVGLTTYRYLPDQVEINRTRVAYKPDGSVHDFDQATTYSGTSTK